MPPTRRTRHTGIWWSSVGLLLGALALAPAVLRADQPTTKQPAKPADDADLMEFLGGIGGEDENLINFLGRTDPRKIAAASVPKQPPPTNGQSSSADPGSQKQ